MSSCIGTYSAPAHTLSASATGDGSRAGHDIGAGEHCSLIFLFFSFEFAFFKPSGVFVSLPWPCGNILAQKKKNIRHLFPAQIPHDFGECRSDGMLFGGSS